MTVVDTAIIVAEVMVGPPGPPGDTGPQGDPGDPGGPGDPGPPGLSFRSGHGTPDNTLGADGDSYRDIDDPNQITYLKVAGVWSLAVQMRGDQGIQGVKGDTGDIGPQGDPGPGVPVGGTAGQVLAKVSTTNYDTHWIDESGTVTSVAGRTGAVTLTTSDIGGLGNIATHATTEFDPAGAAATAQSNAIAASQPLDSDLTAIAALTTTAYGRALLAVADTAGLLTAAGLGSAAIHPATDFDTAGAAAAAQSASQPLDSDLTAIAALATTSFGRGLLTVVDAAGLRTSAGLGGAATLNVGTTAGTVAAGDDSRITGAAQKASNLSDLANAGTARTNLGLGTAATHATGDFLQTANNLSDVTAATARTNLGLGTSATHPTGDFAQTANNLSDLATPATARTNLGLVTIASSGSASDLSSGTVPAGRMPALTGDITTSAGAVATTLATTNSSPGTTGDASHTTTMTTNAKGLTTANTAVLIQIAESQVTSLTTDLAAKAADSAVVHNTGAETVAGVKTFSSSPVVPDGSFTEAKVTNLTTDLAAKATNAQLAPLLCAAYR